MRYRLENRASSTAIGAVPFSGPMLKTKVVDIMPSVIAPITLPVSGSLMETLT